VSHKCPLGVLASICSRCNQTADEVRQVVDINRLLEESDGAQPHRLDRHWYGAAPSDHHDRDVRCVSQERPEHFRPDNIRQVQIHDRYVRVLSLACFDGFTSGCDDKNSVPFFFQTNAKHLARSEIVVND
jgi:hypothetical protein